MSGSEAKYVQYSTSKALRLSEDYNLALQHTEEFGEEDKERLEEGIADAITHVLVTPGATMELDLPFLSEEGMQKLEELKNTATEEELKNVFELGILE